MPSFVAPLVSAFFHSYSEGRNVVLADGAVRFLAHGNEAALVSGLLTINDGEGWAEEGFESKSIQFKKPKYGNWLRLGLFLFIVCLPTPWVWLNPNSSIGKPLN